MNTIFASWSNVFPLNTSQPRSPSAEQEIRIYDGKRILFRTLFPQPSAGKPSAVWYSKTIKIMNFRGVAVSRLSPSFFPLHPTSAVDGSLIP